METYGEKLHRLRENRDFQEIAGELGITVQALRAYEGGKRTPRDEVKQRIDAALSRRGNFFKKEEHNKCTLKGGPYGKA